MAFVVTPILTTTADGIAAWCGVPSPTPVEAAALEFAATVAEDTIKRYRNTDALEAEYATLAVEMGAYLYQKRGVDNAIGFSENGYSRQYETGSIPPSLLGRIKLPVVSG